KNGHICLVVHPFSVINAGYPPHRFSTYATCSSDVRILGLLRTDLVDLEFNIVLSLINSAVVDLSPLITCPRKISNPLKEDNSLDVKELFSPHSSRRFTIRDFLSGVITTVILSVSMSHPKKMKDVVGP